MTNEHHPITLHEVEEEIHKRVSVIDQEFTNGFNLIKHQPKSVTFFGSARTIVSDKHYEQARGLANALSKEGYTIFTGGGPGIMEAANRGAFEAHGRSIGLNIKLPHEQTPNAYITEEMPFYYFFTRKVMLSFSAEAYVFLPGGFGTLDEFFEILTLVQTNKIEQVPIILIGSDFWLPLQVFIEEVLAKTFKTIDFADMNLYTITDSQKDAVDIIKSVPVRNGMRLHFKEDEHQK